MLSSNSGSPRHLSTEVGLAAKAAEKAADESLLLANSMRDSMSACSVAVTTRHLLSQKFGSPPLLIRCFDKGMVLLADRLCQRTMYDF